MKKNLAQSWAVNEPLLVLFSMPQRRCPIRSRKQLPLHQSYFPPGSMQHSSYSNHKDTSLNIGAHDVAIDIKVDANEFALRKHNEEVRGPILQTEAWMEGEN